MGSEEPQAVDVSPTFLELYKLTVEMADRVSARRATVNSFFFTLNAALVAAIGFAQPSDAASGGRDSFGLIYMSAAGIVLAAAWWVMLRSFRDLNRAKFAVIGEMEKSLPVEPFNREWAVLKSDPVKPWQRRYAELSTVERVVPVVFAAIYLAAIIRFA